MKGRISQETLAERLGTSQPGLSHWLNGRSQPSLDDINRIADEIGVSRVWLTHGLGYESGPGKRLLDVVMSDALGDGDLEALAITAEQLAAARSNLQKALGADPDSLSTTEEIKNKTNAGRTV